MRAGETTDIQAVMPDVTQMQAMILGSERGIRRLDPTQSYPHALSELTGVWPASDNRQSVLEWTLTALSQAGVRDRLFVGGYHIQKVVAKFPTLRFAFHQAWERQASVGAMVLGLQSATPGASLVVVMGDVVLRAAAVQAWPSIDAVGFGVTRAAIEDGGTWSIQGDRPVAGSTHRSAGVLLVPASLVDRVRAVSAQVLQLDPLAGFDELARALAAASVPLVGVDMTDAAASVQRPRDLASFVLGTKAQTLQRLAPLITGASIPRVFSLTVARWRTERAQVLSDLHATLHADRLVVRSSSLLEDRFEASNAGAFHSELDVAPDDLPAAIERVIASYAAKSSDKDEARRGQDQVLVQPYVADAVCNGVLFTRVPDDGSPYQVLNYELIDGRTDSITSGRASSSRVTICARDATLPDDDHWSTRVLRLGQRLEQLIGHDGLDIEFVVDARGQLHLLQVRPLAIQSMRRRAYGDEDVRFELDQIGAAVDELVTESPRMLGRRGALGVMPDWNPAEIIGVCPRPLALSIYRQVVTDDVWARARQELGYRPLHHTPLMHALGGRPYIDVRASLNSLLPATLDSSLGSRLIDAAIGQLHQQPQLHDKIEFELMPTCGDLDPQRWRDQLRQYEFSSRECDTILRSTVGHTDRLLALGGASVDRMLAQTRSLKASRDDAAQIAARGSTRSHLQAARLLLDATTACGTLPFASLARCAFIALSLLRSLERTGVLSSVEYASVLAGLPSVAGEVAEDLRDCRAGKLERGDFLERHGHLRPGTYDILTPSYAEAPERYFADASDAATIDQPHRVSQRTAREILFERHAAIAAALHRCGFSATAHQMIEFICGAIPGRELAKHEFTKNISMALSHLALAGETLGLGRDQLSFLPVARLLQLAIETPSAGERTELDRIIGLTRKRHELTTALRLPHLLFDRASVMHFTISALRPNFVTRERAHGPGRLLRVGTTPTGADLAGAIVLIENADPGYDWVFSHRIAGLVTKYGGVASHMAIRAAEFRVPAAIGCGDTIFDPLVGARTIELDCAAEHVRGAA
jgi:hypothetical protein